MMILKILSGLMLMVGMGCSQQQNQTGMISEKLSAKEFKEAISQNGNTQLIDIRTPAEYQAGHIPAAENIDFYAPDFMEKMEQLDKNEPIYIYCASGGRSGNAASKLGSAGFTKIYDLNSGFGGWSRAGYEKE